MNKDDEKIGHVSKMSQQKQSKILLRCPLEKETMNFGDFLNFLRQVYESLLSMLGLGTVPQLPQGAESLRVFIKYGGKSVQVDLDPKLTVGKVKDEIAPKLKVKADEIKIIFAGNELPDHFVLESSDVGQHSYLHAVRVHIASASLGEHNESSPSPAPIDPDQILANRTRTFSTGEASSLEESSFTTELESSSQPPVTVKESDFFVFCSECGDLEEGKLRVRCSSCLSGAFTVHQHPDCWANVLTPKEIQGSCQEGCQENFAQFYFKCTKHVTKGEDDSSPPLPLVKRNREEVPCLACGDVKKIALIFQCPSSHVTCIDCFKEYSLVKLNQREFVQDSGVGYTLGCPALCENSLISDPHHFKLLGKYQYDRYQRFGTEECLLQMGGLFCPQPDCGMGIIPADSNCDKIACLHGCGYVFCRKCLEGWHLGNCRGASSAPAEDCSSGGFRSTGYFVSVDRAQAASWGDPNRRALRLSTKPCPNCRVPTERAGGCMHMECTKCKFAWCWVCQTKWSRDCMGNHWFG